MRLLPARMLQSGQVIVGNGGLYEILSVSYPLPQNIVHLGLKRWGSNMLLERDLRWDDHLHISEQQDLVTARELATYLGVTPGAVRNWSREGDERTEPVGWKHADGERGHPAAVFDWPSFKDWLVETGRFDPTHGQLIRKVNQYEPEPAVRGAVGGMSL